MNPDARYEKQLTAYKTYWAAIRDGRLIRKACQICGNLKAEGHHDDYDRPLEVQWLCKSHHGKLHATLQPAPRVISFNGETLRPKDWATRTGIHESTVCYCIDYYGWHVALALSLRPASPSLVGRIRRLVRAARHCLTDLQKNSDAMLLHI
jgi:hypothetical protein